MKVTHFLMLAILIQGCASNTSLSDKKRESIESVDVYMAVAQDEIFPQINASNSVGWGYFAFGLVGAVIASEIDKTVNERRSRSEGERFESFWNATLDVDYRVLVPKYLAGAVDSHFLISGSPDKAGYALLPPVELIARVNALEENTGLVYLVPSYEFIDDYKKLRTVISVEIHQAPKITLDKKPIAIYSSTISHDSKSYGDGGDESLRYWEENGASLYREKLRDGLVSVAKILAFDIGNSGKNCKGAGSIYSQDVTKKSMMTIAGVPLDVSNELDVIRSWSGFIYSLEKDDSSEAEESLRVNC